MKIKLGDYNELEVVKFVDFGLYLDGGEEGEILLPLRYVSENVKEKDILRVFIYLDNEERLVATTLEPYIKVGEFASLKVSWVNRFGAFLDWGLMKDLFVPFREQKMKMEQGKEYFVHCYIDEESYRIVASAKIEHFLSKETPNYQDGDSVNIVIWQKTDLGFKAVIENKYSGLLYENEVFQPMHSGMKMKAYVKHVREDGKIDLELQREGFKKVDDFSESLLHYIKEHDGFTKINDKTDAEEIYSEFGVSKKTFKKAVGDLYKKKLIVLCNDGIHLA